MGASKAITGVMYRVECPGGAPIRVQPGDDAAVAWWMSNRSPVIVCSITGDWARIAIPIEAWVKRDQLARIGP